LATRANRREQRLQSALLDRLTFKYERLVAREIARTMLNANLSDPMGIEAAEAAHAERLSKIMGRMWLESGDQMVSQVFGIKKKSLLSSFEPTVGVNTIMTDYVRQWGAAKVVQISRTTTNQLKSVIKGGIEEGLSERDVGKLIRERAPTIAASRAQTIARTETHAAANFAVQQSAESTGIEMMREWVSAENERTREAHLEANGQIVGMQEDFVVDGENLAYPGDPSGSPENVINCRCSVVFTEKTTDIAPSITPEPQEQETQTQQPNQQFDYESYQGVTSVAEAEAYVLEKGIAQNVSFKGMSPAGISKAIGAAHEVTERFNLAPLGYIGPILRDTRHRYKGVRGANAAVFPSTQAMHLPTKFGDLKDAQRQIDAKKVRSAFYEKERLDALAKRNVSAEVKSRIDRMASGDYTWSITADTASAERAKTMYHEYGHVLHLVDKRIGSEIDGFLNTNRPRASGWDLLASKYGNANDREYVAEAFAIYMTKPESDHYRIHPALLSIFKKQDRKK
jgi:hypothetical protein